MSDAAVVVPAAPAERARLLSRPGAWLREWKQKFTLAECSGGLGDLGLLIPLVLGLAKQNSIFFVPALFFAGLFNLVTGLLWDVPMCVQPMKTIAAVALAENMPANQVAAAGILVSAMVFFLGFSRLIEVVNQVIPMSVVHGMQLGLGFSLMRKGMAMILDTEQYAERGDCYLTAWCCGALALYLQSHKERAPTALILFAVGLVLAIERMISTKSDFSFRPEWPARYALEGLSAKDWAYAFGDAALPQLPLTTLNSVVSVCHLNLDLFPDRPVKQRDVAMSVGAMNVFCIVGAMPSCHGAGGLAAQHHFGARSGASMVFLGMCKIILAISVGAPLNSLLDKYPGSVLGIMLILSGIELAKQGKKLQKDPGITVGYVTAICTLTLKTGIACIAGLCAALCMGGAEQLRDWVREQLRIRREKTAGSRKIIMAEISVGEKLGADQLVDPPADPLADNTSDNTSNNSDELADKAAPTPVAGDAAPTGQLELSASCQNGTAAVAAAAPSDNELKAALSTPGAPSA